MPYMREHLEAGFYASMGVVALFIARFHYGYVASQYDVFRFSLLAVIFIVVRSDLPDIDAKSAPISKMFQIAIPGAVVLVSLELLGLWPPLAFALGAVALWLYTTQMPRHRGRFTPSGLDYCSEPRRLLGSILFCTVLPYACGVGCA